MNNNVIKNDRSILMYFLLTVVTFGIYQYYFIFKTAKELNIMCYKDGRNTMGLFLTIILSIVTGGIFFMIWYAMSLARMNEYLKENGNEEFLSILGFVLWDTIGLLIIVGPFISMHKYLKTVNACADVHNS